MRTSCDLCWQNEHHSADYADLRPVKARSARPRSCLQLSAVPFRQQSFNQNLVPPLLPAVAVAVIVVEVGVIEEIVRVIVIEVGAKKLNMVMRECQFVGNLLSQLKFGIRSATGTQA